MDKEQNFRPPVPNLVDSVREELELAPTGFDQTEDAWTVRMH